MLFRQTFAVGPLQCNCTILGCQTSKQAIVIDPGDEVPRIVAILVQQQLQLCGIVHTHAHIDHIGGANELAAATSAPTYLHPSDTFLYEMLPLQAQMLGLTPPSQALRPIERPLKDQLALNFGAQELGVLHTPGHTPGSVCFTLRGAALCFAGDTLFAGSIGRTDLPGGDAAAIDKSIRERLYSLPDDVEVICGHGPSTSIAQERRHNRFVRA